MTDRVGNKEKIASSSKSNNNNDAVHHQSSSHHHQSGSHQKESHSSRPNEENIANDSFLKRYKIIEKIGEGSYSEVLKCQNRQDGTVVACKRLKHIYKSLDDVTSISEIATLRSIQKHSNILQMLEIHYDKTLGKVSLVFELMDINLYELIKDRKRLLPESRVRAIMFQLFRALRHLHKLGVFHRDIKPENILIKTKTDQLKLGDLGSVRGMYSRPPYTEYISTRWYRSPECLLTAGHYSHKMDIWAAGCVFYEVYSNLTLRPLFPGSSEIDQINRINNVLGPPPVKLLDTFQKQAEMERETYRGQSQLNRRQQIQKVLNSYSSRYMIAGENANSKNSVSNSIKGYRRNNIEFHFAGKEGTGLDKILPAHITREAKEIIKTCLFYDPELRPTANRIVQLSYFSELRESYNKNAEKVSSKSVVLICGDTVTDAGLSIELGTLGDHKVRYRRGVSQKSATVKSSTSKTVVEKKPSSIKSVDINNNLYSRKRCTSSRESVVVALARASQSRLSNLVAGASASKAKVVGRGKPGKSDGRVQEPGSTSAIKTSSTNRASRVSNASKEQTPANRRSSSSRVRVRSKHSLLEAQPPESIKKKPHQLARSSSTSFDSVQSPETNDRKYSRQRGRSTPSKDPGNSNIITLPDISLSPYVKPPSELKFLRDKIKSDRSKVVAPLLVHCGGTFPQKTSTVDLHQQQQQQQQLPTQRVAVVPPKVAAAAIKYVKVNNSRRGRGDPVPVLENTGTTDQTESSGTNIGTRETRRRFSATEDTTPYATASSVKIGKLRFRQTSQQKAQQPSVKSTKDTSTTMSSAVPQQQRSKIPVLTTGEQNRGTQSSRRSNKILASPPEQRRESGTMDKWRNTGIPRVIPMSPERERNIQLLKDSLILDNNKRLKIRYQQQQHEQDILNNNTINEVKVTLPGKKASNTAIHGVVGNGRGRKEPTPKTNYDYTSQDTLQSTGEQHFATYSSPSAGVGAGRYRNSTTDYENPDVPETSSASAAALENHQRNMFNEATRMGRIVIPSVESSTKKPVPVKKSSSLYPPEMLHLYSSRYRGPDTNMNILKDSGNSYVKRTNPESKVQEVKEKINYKFEQKRQQQRQQLQNTGSTHKLGSSQPSKVFSDRSFANYSSSLLGAGEEEQFARAGILDVGRMERRPPLPSVPRVGHQRNFRNESPRGTHEYLQQGRRASIIPTTGADRGNRSHRRSSSNARGDKEVTRRKAERMRSTMRDDVFCSSDDDVVISMRKKFDSLISERARKLSESLKSNTNAYKQESSSNRVPLRRKGHESNSDDDMVAMNRRSRYNAVSDKSKKYARRELRARMAESLTMNNFGIGDKWENGEHIRQGLLDNRATNDDDGEWLLSKQGYVNKSGGVPSSMNRSTLYNGPSSVLQARKNNAESELQDTLKYHQKANRIHPFPMQEQQVYRRGQIYTPPTVYQSPQLGTMLHDRNLRYSHNNPMPISGSYRSNPGKILNEIDSLKRRQRI